MFLRVVCLCTVSAMALHSALCAESFCERENLEEESALILGSTFEEEIDLTRVEALYGESDMAANNWDCCGKEACSTLSWSVTAKPIYWLNSHQGEPIGQRLVSQKSSDLAYKHWPVQTKTGQDKMPIPDRSKAGRFPFGEDRFLGMVGRSSKSTNPTVLAITLDEPMERAVGTYQINHASHIATHLVNWTPTEMVHVPMFWGWGGSAELVGETEDGAQHSFSFLGFYSKKDWEAESGGGNLDFTILPTYLSATPFLPLTGIRVQEDGRGLVYFDSLSFTEKNWLCQGRWVTGGKGFITPSVEMGGRFGCSGLYSTWDRDGSASDKALDPFSGGGDSDNTVIFTQNNEVYGGGATLGVTLSVGSGCGCSFYGEGSATLYLAQEKASRDIRYSLLRYKNNLVGMEEWPTTTTGTGASAVTTEDSPETVFFDVYKDSSGTPIKPVQFRPSSDGKGKIVNQYKTRLLKEEKNNLNFQNYLVTVFRELDDDESINPSPPVSDISFSFPKMWKVFPAFDLSAGIEWNCGGECRSFSIRVGWEQHFAANMFTDFVVKDGAYPESYRVKSDLNVQEDDEGKYIFLGDLDLGGQELKQSETIESVCVQEYRAVSTSYFFGGPTVSITMFF